MEAAVCLENYKRECVTTAVFWTRGQMCGRSFISLFSLRGTELHEIGSNSQHFLPLIQTSPTNQTKTHTTQWAITHRTEAEFLNPTDTFCQVRGPIGRSATEGKLLTRP